MADKEEVKAEEKKEETKEETKEVEAKAEDVEMGEGEESKAAEKPKEPEKPKELEEDAPEDPRPKVAAGAVDVSSTDATLNVLPTAGNRLLMSLTEGGCQYLLGGVRATAGLKSGRYMFEVKLVELHNQQEPRGSDRGGPQPKNLLRVGLSTAGSSLYLADGSTDNVSFDSEGFFASGKSRKKVASKFGRDASIAVLVNLNAGAPNGNTISVFKDGARLSEPQAIPEHLLGKPLYPHISYRNVSVEVNFGPTPLRPLPFKCSMLCAAAKEDIEVAAKPIQAPKKEVIFPIGLPEQGYFDAVDMLLEQNPDFEELSDRKIVEWAFKSGMGRPQKGQNPSLDKPDMKFGLPYTDDGSIGRALGHVAPLSGRNFVVPTMKANLLAKSRKSSLQKWSGPEFKKTAMVFMGEPPAEFKQKVQELMLAEKKSKAEAERRKKIQEEERKKAMEEKKKAAEAARKARLAKKSGDDEAKEEPDVEPEEAKAEEPEEIVVELTEEEKKLTFRKSAIPDILEGVLGRCYADFTLPTTEEGFDEVVFKWQGEAEASKALKDWIFAKKLTQRVEDLTPGQAFKDTWNEWTKNLQAWRKLQSEWKDPAKKKALLAKRAEAKKKAAEEKGEEAPKEEEKMEIDVEDLDVFAVEDVCDIGNGEPLFANFAFEDWLLLSTRYELTLLLHSFKKDLNDADRPSFTEKDLAFYYQKYFKKSFNLKSYALDKFPDFVEMIKDTLSMNASNGFLEAVLAEDTPISNFVKLAEDHRRDRQRRLDAGDETAALKFPRNMPQPPRQQPAGAFRGGGGGGGSSRQGGGGGGGYSSSRAGGGSYGGNGARGGGGGSSYGSSAGVKRPYSAAGGGSYYGSGAKSARTSSYGAPPPRYGGGGYGGGSYGRR